jgi:hypothetical protein
VATVQEDFPTDGNKYKLILLKEVQHNLTVLYMMEKKGDIN